MNYPKQAVIFCGGLGSRLRPLTKTLPKPMAPIQEKPFLEYLIQQLQNQGINRFILLTGYLGEIIQDYFGDGRKWGLKIEYSHGSTEWDTGRRLWESKSKLDNKFLLLYADNFIQFNLKKLIDLHIQSNVALTLILAPKKLGNIKINAQGKIEEYKKNRIGKGLNYVEVGYMLVERDYIISLYFSIENSPNINFSNIIEYLVKKNQITGLVVKDSYHSISDMKRLKLMREYLRPKKIILIDRDGIINKKAPPGEYVVNWEDFEWIEDTINSMKYLAKRGFSFIVVTNQAGVARGMVCKEELYEMHKLMISELKSKNIEIHEIYVCPHHWDENCNCRKPKPDLFFQISKKYFLRLDSTIYIGDDIRDVEAAYNAGCGSVLVSSENVFLGKKKPDWIVKVKKLSDALPKIELHMDLI
jgi:histidinol-phosphate phosphatase family protein